MANHQQQPLTSKQAKKKTRMFIISLLVCLIALSAYLYWENTTIEVTFLEVVDSAIPVDFDGFTIAHISDLHNTEFGQQQERLLQKLVEAAPDLLPSPGICWTLITEYYGGNGVYQWGNSYCSGLLCHRQS